MRATLQARAVFATVLGGAAVIAAAAGAYAAAGSAGTISACIRRGTGALYSTRKCDRSDHRLTWSVTGPRGSRGATGPQGTAGPGGQPGSPGPKGDPGVMAAAQNGGAKPPALGGAHTADQTLSDTALSTSAPGKVFAFGHIDLTADCPSPGVLTDCPFTVGLDVDGQPVPGSARSVDVTVFTSAEETLDVFGVLGGVLAGPHHVTLVLHTFLHPPTISNVSGEAHSGALALVG